MQLFFSKILIISFLIFGSAGIGILSSPIAANAATCACYFGADEDCKEVSAPTGGSEANCEAECKKEVGPDFIKIVYGPETFSGKAAINCKVVHALLEEKKAAIKTKKSAAEIKFISPRLNVDIPGLNFSSTVNRGGVLHIAFIGEYISAFFNYLLVISTTIAIVFLMIGGLQYTFGAVSPGQIKKAKDRIKNTVIGLVLLLSVFIILETVNPELLALDALPIEYIEEVPQAVIEHYEATIREMKASDPGATETYKPSSSGSGKVTAEGVPFAVKTMSYPCVPGSSCPGTPRPCKEAIPSNKVTLPGVNISHQYLGLLDCNVSDRTKKRMRPNGKIQMVALHQGYPNENVRGMIYQWVTQFHYGEVINCTWLKSKKRFNKPYCKVDKQKFRTPPKNTPIGSHFAVTPSGKIYQLADPGHIMNHGVNNQHSIGIDLNWKLSAKKKKSGYWSAAQITEIAKLIRGLSKKYGFPINDKTVRGHCEVSESRSDPTYFPLEKLGKELGVTLNPAAHKTTAESKNCHWTNAY